MILLIRWSRRHVLITGAVVLAAVLALTAFFWQEINLETSIRAGESVSGRLIAWRAAIDGIKEHWLLGVGLREGNNEILTHLDPDEYQWLVVDGNKSVPADNQYLNFFLELGLIGLVLWLAMIALLLREGVQKIKRAKQDCLWAMAATASIVGILLNAITFDALQIWPNFILFWVAAGVLHGLAQTTPTRRSAGMQRSYSGP